MSVTPPPRLSFVSPPTPRLSFVSPPTPAARLRRAAATTWQFLRWAFGGPWVGPNPRWIVLGPALWLLLGLPEKGPGWETMLHGPERVIGVIIGSGLLVGLAWFWAAHFRPTQRP